MRFVLLSISTLIIVIEAKIIIDIKAGKNITDTIINYSGDNIDVIGENDIQLFKLNQVNLKTAVNNYYGAIPHKVYLKSPTPWERLYKTHFEQVSRVLRVKSATINGGSIESVSEILAQEFDNTSNKTIKVNAGITQSVDNTMTTSWPTNEEVTVAQETAYDLNVIFPRISGNTSVCYTSSWGRSEEKSESVTIGASTGVEIELQPHQSATAVLSANRWSLEITVEYLITLRGNAIVNFRSMHQGHHIYGPSITGLMKSGGLETEKSVFETIKVGVFADARLKVTVKDSDLTCRCKIN